MIWSKRPLEDYFHPIERFATFANQKHVQVNGEIIHWQSMLEAGDHLTLTFDPEDYEERIAGDAICPSPL